MLNRRTFIRTASGLYLFKQPTIAQMLVTIVGDKTATGFAFMGHDEAGDPNSATTLSHNTSSATLVVIAVSWFGAPGGVTVSDNKGNTYTGLTPHVGAATINSQIWYKNAPTVGSGHTFTVAGGTTYCSLAVTWFSGPSSGPDAGIENGTSGASGTSLATGSITPTVNNELVIAAIGIDTSATNITINSGMTPFSLIGTGSINEGVGIAYKIQSAAAAINPTWSWTTSSASAVSIASFKP